jgi:hypothetical protein
MNRWQGLGGAREYEDEVSSGGYTFAGPFCLRLSSTFFLSLVFAFPFGVDSPALFISEQAIERKIAESQL